jgi:hypothetical protein
MENQEWRLLKELPDVEVGSIGIEKNNDVYFYINEDNDEWYIYDITFAESKPDWFEKVKPKDYNVFERLIKARDSFVNGKGNFHIVKRDEEITFVEMEREYSPFRFPNGFVANRFIEENKEDLIKFFNI